MERCECGGELGYVGKVYFSDGAVRDTWQCVKCGVLWREEEVVEE